MGVKDNFTQEEWKALLKAPMLVSYAVAGAAPSGREEESNGLLWPWATEHYHRGLKQFCLIGRAPVRFWRVAHPH